MLEDLEKFIETNLAEAVKVYNPKIDEEGLVAEDKFSVGWIAALLHVKTNFIQGRVAQLERASDF